MLSTSFFFISTSFFLSCSSFYYSRSCSPSPVGTSRSGCRDKCCGSGRGRGRDRGNNHDRSPSPATSASPDDGHGRGRKHDSGRGTRRCTVPADFPNCHSSLTNPHPPFIGDPQGTTFSLKKSESASAYTYFLLSFDDYLLTHIANQMNLYARLHPFHRTTYRWFDTNTDELRSFLGIFIAKGCVSL